MIIHLFYIMSGILAYASLHHLLMGLNRPFNRLNLMFAAMCAMASVFALVHSAALIAVTAPEYVIANRIGLFLINIFFVLLLWFLAEYTDERPRPLLIALSAIILLLTVVNLVQPFSLQYREMPGLVRLNLPWGEVLTNPTGKISAWFQISILIWLLVFVFGFYALLKFYRRGHKSTALVMIVAVALFLLGVTHGTLTRLGVFQFVPLGGISLLGMVLVMSMVISYEMRQRSERMRIILDKVPSAVYMKDTEGRYLMVNHFFEEAINRQNREILGKTNYELLPKDNADFFTLRIGRCWPQKKPVSVMNR